MDIGKAFTFTFDDEKWINKVLVGGLFVLASSILIGIPFLIGYMLQLIRNVMQGMEKPLPEWDELGEKFKEGLFLAIIYVIWTIPLWLIGALLGLSGVGIAGISDNSNAVGSFIGIVSLCFSCLATLWGIAIALLMPAITIRFALNPELKSGFEFAEIWQFTRDNLGNIIITLLLSIVAAIISSFGVILCIIGVVLTYFWYYLVYAHLVGQIYVHRKGATPSDVLPATM